MVSVATRFTATPTAATTIRTAPSTRDGCTQSADGVVGHQGGDDEERDAVGGRGQDLRPLQAVGVRPRLGTGGQPDGHEGACDRPDVDQHVAGVGQEGDRVGGDGGRHLEHHEADQQDQRECQGAPVARHRRPTVAVVVARVLSHAPSRGPRG